MKTISFLILISVFGFSPCCFADDLYLTGSLQSGSYFSDANIISQGACTIDPGVNVTVEADNSIRLGPGFQAKYGCVFTANPGDGDGIPNYWEMTYFGHTNWVGSDDPDGDRLTNLQEYALGTNPGDGVMDNDGDELPDWWELTYFENLEIADCHGDADSDGIQNCIEFKFETDPGDSGSKPKPGCIYEYDALGRIKKAYRVK